MPLELDPNFISLSRVSPLLSPGRSSRIRFAQEIHPLVIHAHPDESIESKGSTRLVTSPPHLLSPGSAISFSAMSGSQTQCRSSHKVVGTKKSEENISVADISVADISVAADPEGIKDRAQSSAAIHVDEKRGTKSKLVCLG